MGPLTYAHVVAWCRPPSSRHPCVCLLLLVRRPSSLIFSIVLCFSISRLGRSRLIDPIPPLSSPAAARIDRAMKSDQLLSCSPLGGAVCFVWLSLGSCEGGGPTASQAFLGTHCSRLSERFN